MVMAAREGRKFSVAPRVVVEEVQEDGVVDKVDKGELVQAGSPFAVGGKEGGGAGSGDAPPPLFPEQANIVSPFPKGGNELDAAGVLLANILKAVSAAQAVLPGAAAVYEGIEGLIMELDKGGGGWHRRRPPRVPRGSQAARGTGV